MFGHFHTTEQHSQTDEHNAGKLEAFLAYYVTQIRKRHNCRLWAQPTAQSAFKAAWHLCMPDLSSKC